MTDDNSPGRLQDEQEWFVQFCLYGQRRGEIAIMPAEDAIRQNIAEAKKVVPLNFWATIGTARSEREAKEVRRARQIELANGNGQNNRK